jgi:cold shock protein
MSSAVCFVVSLCAAHRFKGLCWQGRLKERLMSDGKVKWFNPKKGYGFIATADGRDIFVHYSSISSNGYKTLTEGDAVTFDVVEGDKGLRAENVIAKAAAEAE